MAAVFIGPQAPPLHRTQLQPPHQPAAARHQLLAKRHVFLDREVRQQRQVLVDGLDPGLERLDRRQLGVRPAVACVCEFGEGLLGSLPTSGASSDGTASPVAAAPAGQYDP